MHFAKTYTQLLLSLPPELRDNAIEYRKLKKLINKVVTELEDLGYPPETLHQVLSSKAADPSGKGKAKETDPSWFEVHSSHDSSSGLPRVVYEIKAEADHLQPRLRLFVNTSTTESSTTQLASENGPDEGRSPGDSAEEGASPEEGLPGPGPSSSAVNLLAEASDPNEQVIEISTHSDTKEIIIPLASDTMFFEVLMDALQTLGTQLNAVSDEFMANLSILSRSISSAAKPMSSTTSSFQPHSNASNPANISVMTPSSIVQLGHQKTDLYSWREIFQLYVDTEVFESHSEKTRGERSIEDAEERLELFKQRLAERGMSEGKALKLKQSRDALQTFLALNSFILDLKRFQFATAEATRKILKKHAKRTALPVSPTVSSRFNLPTASLLHSHAQTSTSLAPIARPTNSSLSLMLVQALGETLLPIIPHIDDYACVICTSIAFKPIRLRCGHLFCVRCLVKMQKRGKGNCPMCRAPTVLAADGSNVDWALLNFMKDWFPKEARQKLEQSEKEAAEEHMQELGFNTEGCIIS